MMLNTIGSEGIKMKVISVEKEYDRWAIQLKINDAVCWKFLPRDSLFDEQAMMDWLNTFIADVVVHEVTRRKWQ